MNNEFDTLDNNQINDNQNFIITQKIKGYLKETAKWAKFLSIMGFIGVGLMLIAGLVIIAITPSFVRNGGVIMGVTYLVMAGLYIMPVIYLYKFSNDISESLERENVNQLELGFESLKSHYKYIGIFTIVIISIYALLFIIGLLAGTGSIM